MTKVDLEGMMELNGTLDFQDGRTVVIYGSNQQGKTNVINAIRYAFLKEMKGRGRRREDYDDRTLPTREELIFGKQASIAITFQYNGAPYVLKRTIASGGKRETTDLFRENDPTKGLDAGTFLKERLKVSLLDVLFSPEITGGFRQLYAGHIDEDVAEMFKEISTVRLLAENFIGRLDRLKTSAEAAGAQIELAYSGVCEIIERTSPHVTTLAEYKNLQKFEPGMSNAKIDALHQKVMKVTSKLREDGLVKEFTDAVEKARELGEIKELLAKDDEMRQKTIELAAVRHDHLALTNWVESLGQVDFESSIRDPPRLKNEKLMEQVRGIVEVFYSAKRNHDDATNQAVQEGIRLDEIADRRKESMKILKLLVGKGKTGIETIAAVTKVDGAVHVVLPVKLLVSDPSFADISNHPLPKGTEDEMRTYLTSLVAKVKRLTKISNLDKGSEELLDAFRVNGVRSANTFVRALDSKGKALEESITAWENSLATCSSSFAGRTINAPDIRFGKDVKKFAKRVVGTVSDVESNHLARVNATIRELNISVPRLEKEELLRVARQVEERQQELPQLNKVEKLLAENKAGWQLLDQAYADYSQMPIIGDATKDILIEILSACFDEGKLRDMIASTYTEIISTLRERHLIKAITELSEGRLKGVLKYGEKSITHPAGSEKAFFSLAILTALAKYFQTPVLIDEVANNLDSTNLRAFFGLVNEFKEQYGVQFVLSMKQTKDFDLEGWVAEFRDGISVYEMRDKEIVPLKL